MEQKNVSPVQSPGSRRSSTKNPAQSEEQSKELRKSPRKNPAQSEEQSKVLRKSPRKNPDQSEEQSKWVRRSPRKNPDQSEVQRTSHMSVLLFSYKLLIIIFFFIINKEMNQMFMPFYIFSKVKLQRQLPGNVSQK